MAFLGDTKQLDARLSSVESAFLGIDLLEAQAVPRFVEVVQTRSGPLLVFLGVVLLEVIKILCQLLEDFLLELAFDLTRARAAWCLEVLGLAIELPALGRAVGLDVLAGRRCIDKHTLVRLDVLHFGGRHIVDDDCRCDGWAGKSWQTDA
jgi:hypothetical protein